MTDRLLTGQSLGLNKTLWSKNGRAVLFMQADSNLCLYAGNRGPNDIPNPGAYNMWCSNTINSGGTQVVMQSDGNLVMSDTRTKRVIWSTNTPGHPGGFILVQDDGNLVMYDKSGQSYWASNSAGFQKPSSGPFGDIGHFIGDAASTAGHAFHSATHAIASAAGTIGHALGSVPVIGGALHATFDYTLGAPIALGDAVVSGQRLDKAALGYLSAKVSDIKEIAPYAQAVASEVPGLGTGVSAIIGGASALASGRPIDEIAQAAIAGAVPGGPLGSSLFNVAASAARGKGIDLSGISIPGVDPELLKHGLSLASQIASGNRVDKALTDEAYNALPPAAKVAVDVARGKGVNSAAAVANAVINLVPEEQRKAMTTGLAVGQARVIQENVQHAVAGSLPTKLIQTGLDTIKSNPVLQSVGNSIDGKHGFEVGVGLMQKAGVTPFVINALRTNLSSENKKGFDAALATHIGLVTVHKPVTMLEPKKLAAYYVTQGVQAGARHQQEALLKAVTQTIAGKQGAAAGALQIKDKKHWWTRLFIALGIHKEPVVTVTTA